MMSYNPKIHHRKSIRLKGYDYSQAGLYFITICTQNREHFFGEIRRGEHVGSPQIAESCSQKMILNDAGKMIEKWYYELENKFPDIRCHEMIVMPNHFHCIVENVGIVGADLRVCPDTIIANGNNDIVVNNIAVGNIINDNITVGNITVGNILGEHKGSPLHHVIQWFKTMTTNEYIRGVKTMGWQRFDGKLWQRNYWEHIIRDENAYHRISNYIINNPQKWDNDKLKK